MTNRNEKSEFLWNKIQNSDEEVLTNSKRPYFSLPTTIVFIVECYTDSYEH